MDSSHADEVEATISELFGSKIRAEKILILTRDHLTGKDESWLRGRKFIGNNPRVSYTIDSIMVWIPDDISTLRMNEWCPNSLVAYVEFAKKERLLRHPI